jgi:PAS domain S-box-containing protein
MQEPKKRKSKEKQGPSDSLQKTTEEWYRLLFDNVSDAVFVHYGPDETKLPGTFIEANDIACQRLGYTREEFLKMRPSDIDAPETIHNIPAMMERLLKEKHVLWEGVHLSKDGRRIPVEIHNRLFESEGKQLILSTVRDITERKQDQEILKESEEAFRGMFETARDFQYISTLDGKIINLNTSAKNFLGYSDDELKELNMRDFYADPQERVLYAEKVLKEGFIENCALRIKKKDGTVADTLATSIVRKDKEGNIIGFQGGVKDITERKKMELALQESQELYAKLISAIPDAVLQTDMNGKIVFINDVGVQLSGYTSADELIGKNVFSLIATEDHEKTNRNMARMLERRIEANEYYLITKDGRRIPFEVNGNVLRNPDGSAYGRVHICRNIAERKKAEEELRESEERYRLILENIEDGYIELDLRGNMTFFNAAMCRIANMSHEELLGINYREYTSPDTAKEMFRVFNGIFTTGKPVTLKEYEIIWKDGSRRNLELSVSLIRDRQMSPIGFRGIARDVTEKKSLEEMYRTVAEKSFAGVFIVQKGAFKYVNANVAAYTGYTPEELIGRKTESIVHPDDLKTLKQRAIEMLKGTHKSPYEYRITTRDGEIRWIIEIVTPILFKGERALVGNSMDITERKQAEEALKESEEKYRLSFENVSDVICSIDRDFRFVTVSPSVEKILGYKPVEIIGRSVEALNDIIAPESLEEALSATIKVLNGESISDAVFSFVAKDRTRKIGEVSASPIIRGGTIVGVIAIARDITERKQTEQTLNSSFERLRKALGAIIQAMAVTVEARDPYTAGHQRGVADLARSIATEMGLTSDQIDGIRMASTIHDIGKISIPAEILSKPSKLTKLEFELIKIHAQSGHDILKDIEFPWPIARIVLEHHERMNGTGYPKGLIGEQTLIESRILVVADVVEAMGAHRPYRPAPGLDLALEEISKNRGTLYDPEVVDACLRLFHTKGYKLIQS